MIERIKIALLYFLTRKLLGLPSPHDVIKIVRVGKEFKVSIGGRVLAKEDAIELREQARHIRDMKLTGVMRRHLKALAYGELYSAKTPEEIRRQHAVLHSLQAQDDTIEMLLTMKEIVEE